MATLPLNKKATSTVKKPDTAETLGCNSSTGDKIYWEPVKDAVGKKLGCDSSTGDKIYWSPTKLEELKKQIADGKVSIKDLDPELVKKLR